MRKTKTTPGPWHFDGRRVTSPNRGKKYQEIARLPLHLLAKEDIANGELIATLPDLIQRLAALKIQRDHLHRELEYLVRLLEPLENAGTLQVPALATLNGARAALTRAAEGETP